MQVNQEKSGIIKGVGMSKLQIAIDGATREEVASRDAQEMAREAAAAAGFGGGGLCDQPMTGAIGADGEIIEGEDALNPNTEVHGFRTEFRFAQRA